MMEDEVRKEEWKGRPLLTSELEAERGCKGGN